MALRPDFPVVTVVSRGEWRLWLAENADSSRGVWVSTRKKASLKPGDEYISIEVLNRECLCFGWVDSKVATIDSEFSALLCTPRKQGSGWSAVNKARVADLDAAGLMEPRGLGVVAASKADGSWDALNDVEALIVPADLATAFAKFPDASAHWENFPRSVKRAILEWIQSAKKPETRQARIEDTASKANLNIRANQWSRST